jgi:long-chain acyl-CoA synthetase
MPAEIVTLVDLYSNSTAAFADNPFIGRRNEDGDWDWTTYREFGDMIDKARGGLAALGIEKGDRVAIISDNRLEWAVGAYATYSLGASWVPMYEAETQEDWVHILKDSGAKVLFAATDGIRSQVDEIRESIPELGTIVVIDDPAGGEAINFTELLTRGAENPAPIAVVEGSDVAGLIYTSGTTGKPKGVMLTHSNFASNINAISEIFPLEQEDRSASFLPWAHSFG